MAWICKSWEISHPLPSKFLERLIPSKIAYERESLLSEDSRAEEGASER